MPMSPNGLRSGVHEARCEGAAVLCRYLMPVRRRTRTLRSPFEPRAGLSLAGIVWRLLAAVVLLWLAGWLWFALTLPDPAPLAARTDAVVVLTGGAGRLARGLEVLAAKSAPRLLLSGVGRATRAQIAEVNGVTLKQMRGIDLGYEAVDTRSNAEETTRWVARNGFKSLRLVTSAEHMRRARLELAATLPASVRIVTDAVPVEPRAPGIAIEYSKYLVRRFARNLGAD